MPIYYNIPPEHPADLLSIDEAAEIAKVQPKTVRRWVDAGDLFAKQESDRRWHIIRGDLTRFLASRTRAVSKTRTATG